MGGFCCYSKQSKAGRYIHWALRVIARITFFQVQYLNGKKISFMLWEQNRLKQSFAARFPSQRTLRLCPNCSARKMKTCWCTCATLLQNVKKHLRMAHLVLVYWALLPTQTVINELKQKDQVSGNRLAGKELLLHGQWGLEGGTLNIQANVFGGQKGSAPVKREAGNGECKLSSCLLAVF